MEASDITERELEEVRSQVVAHQKMGERYRSDPDFRSRIDGGDVTEALSDLGVDLPSGIEARIVANTADTLHMVLPPDPNADLSDEALAALSGGCSYGAWLQGHSLGDWTWDLHGKLSLGQDGSGGAT